MRAFAGLTLLQEGHEAILLVDVDDTLVVHQRQNILVKDIAFEVSEFFEACKGRIVFCLALQTDAQLLQTLLESVPAAELAQHDFVGRPAHVLSAHDLVGITCLQNTILVNSTGMRKRIRAHNGLVRLYDKSGDLAHHAAGSQNVLGINIDIQVEIVAPRLDGHYDFFECAVTCPLSKAVDGAFHLAGAADLHAGQRVRHSHAQVVVAVHGPNGFVAVGHAFTQRFNEIAIQLWNGIADGVGHVDGGGAFTNHGLDHAAQKIHIAAVPIFGAEFDIGTQIACEPHRLHGLLQHLVGSHAQLFFHVQR